MESFVYTDTTQNEKTWMELWKHMQIKVTYFLSEPRLPRALNHCSQFLIGLHLKGQTPSQEKLE
jgi:hypothetical protein